MTLLIAAQFITHTLRLDQPSFQPIDEVDWAQLVDYADVHLLTPLLYSTWRNAGLLASLPQPIQDRLAQAYADNTLRNSYIRRELLDLDQILTAADVPHLLLIGWSLIEHLYSDPAWRVLYGHHFLLPPDYAERGYQALRMAGFCPSPDKDQRIAPPLPALWRNDSYSLQDPSETQNEGDYTKPYQGSGYLFDPHYPRPVKLHTQLWEQGWRGLNIRQLSDPWIDALTQPIAGAPMLRLSDENTLIYLAIRFACHMLEREIRLNQLLDLAIFDQKMMASLDWDHILRSAAQSRVSRFVYASLFLAHQIFGSPLPPKNIWQRLAAATPSPFRVWLAEQGSIDVLTFDFGRQDKDYRLTFLAATSVWERWGIVCLAALRPLDRLIAKHYLRHRWLWPLFYPRYNASASRPIGNEPVTREYRDD